jgi:hypothetical protein
VPRARWADAITQSYCQSSGTELLAATAFGDPSRTPKPDAFKRLRSVKPVLGMMARRV